jgi:hypothetical protein
MGIPFGLSHDSRCRGGLHRQNSRTAEARRGSQPPGPPGSLVLENVSQGWPAILANLKTLLETGDTLPADQDTARQDTLRQDTLRQDEKSLQH